LKKMEEDVLESEANLADLKKMNETADQIAQAIRAFHTEHLKKDLIDRSKLEVKEQIGADEFSKVYKGVYRGDEVAIRVFKSKVGGKTDRFFQEEEALL